MATKQPKGRPGSFESLKEQLLRAGAPLYVVEFVIAQRPSGLLYQALNWGFILIMIAGFGVGAFLWIHLESISDANAVGAAKEIGAILFEHYFGVSMLIALFGWIFAAGLIAFWLSTYWTRGLAIVFAYSTLASANRLFMKIEKFAEDYSGGDDPKKFLLAWAGAWIRRTSWAALILFAFSAAFLSRELSTQVLYSPIGYVAAPFFPWGEGKEGEWKDADVVYLGCNHTTGRNASDNIVYIVVFTSGDERRISSAKPVEGVWLDQIEIIDAAFADSKADFQRWSFRNRNPLHPECLSAQTKQLSDSDAERIYKLLRVGELEGDK